MTLVVRPGFNYDADASAYIDAVEAADQADTPGIGAMETGVRYAINDFVIGCKQDGIWSAIKASCILAGARTLAGALIPLAGTAPTNPFVNPANESLGRLFVSGDYNRETGLVGNGSTKYLNSNRNNNADPPNSKHCSLWVTSAGSANTSYLGAGIVDTGTTAHFITSTNGYFIINNGTYIAGDSLSGGASATGLVAASRNSATNVSTIYGTGTKSYAQSSETPYNGTINIFGRGYSNAVSSPTNARLAFYSIGEAVNLVLLNARVTTLINAFAAAIP